LQELQKAVLSELEQEEKSWEKPYDLCRDALELLFAQAAETERTFSREELEEFLRAVLENLANEQVREYMEELREKNNDPDVVNTLVNFMVMAHCRQKGGVYYSLLNTDSEEEKQEEENEYVKFRNRKSTVEFANKECFLYSDEEVLAQLAQTIPTECERYYPRLVAPGSTLTDVDVLREAYREGLHVCLMGECGTGKTLSLKYLAFTLKVPYKSISLDGACTREDLLGTYVRARRGDRTDWMWVDGWLTKMVRYGGIFVAEEINAAPPEILFVLHGLLGHVSNHLDLTQIGGDIVEAHPNFFFAATMNPDYAGTNQLNAALLDRFDIVLNYDYDTELEANFIRDNNLRAVFAALRERYPHEISVPPSSRMMQQFEHNLVLFGFEAARNFLINKFPVEERDIVATVFDSKMGMATRRT